MNWLAWRQHRKQFIVAGIFLALFAALMIPTGIHYWNTYQHALATCSSTNTCSQVNSGLFQGGLDSLILHLVPLAFLFIPIILGIFWGVPLLTREYADGTNKLVWTQSVSRKKWLSVKLIWIIVGTIVISAAFAVLMTWWSKTNDAIYLNRFNNEVFFNTQGIVPVAYSIFAVSLGILLGAWFRRTMVALGVTLALLIAIVLVVVPNFVRPHYETPVSIKMSLTGNVRINGVPTSARNPITNGATLVVSQTIVNSHNQPLDWANPPKQCIVTPSGNESTVIVGGHSEAALPSKVGGGFEIQARNGGPPVSLNCLQQLGYLQENKFQPSYRYWDFQRIETGLFLALSTIPIGATYWLVLRRDA